MQKVKLDEQMTARMIDCGIEKIKTFSFSDKIQVIVEWLTKGGLYGLYLFGLLGIITTVTLMIKYEIKSFEFCALGILGSIIFAVVSHYTALKIIINIQPLIDGTPTQFSTKSILDISTLLTTVIGSMSCIIGLFIWIKFGDIKSFISGFCIFLVCLYVLSLLLKYDKLLNISASNPKVSAGEELIGIISLISKILLKMIPAAFGSGIIYCLYLFIEIMIKKYGNLNQIITDSYALLSLCAFFALLPLFGYIGFLLCYFLVDIAKAILRIPVQREEAGKTE